MMFVIGIVLFALAILISVALHECGHMWVAQATGMKVRRYCDQHANRCEKHRHEFGNQKHGIKDGVDDEHHYKDAALGAAGELEAPLDCGAGTEPLFNARRERQRETQRHDYPVNSGPNERQERHGSEQKHCRAGV